MEEALSLYNDVRARHKLQSVCSWNLEERFLFQNMKECFHGNHFCYHKMSWLDVNNIHEWASGVELSSCQDIIILNHSCTNQIKGKMVSDVHISSGNYIFFDRNWEWVWVSQRVDKK